MRPLPPEAVRGPLLQRAVNSDVGLAFEPLKRTGVEVFVGDEVLAVEEALTDVPDRPFHLALRLGPVRLARPDPEAPVDPEAHELRVLDQSAAAVTVVVEDDGFIWSNRSSEGTPRKYRNANSAIARSLRVRNLWSPLTPKT